MKKSKILWKKLFDFGYMGESNKLDITKEQEYDLQRRRNQRP